MAVEAADDKAAGIRKAATVLVVRQGVSGVEVFMVQRPARGTFPNLHVFPGGKVESADAQLSHLCHGLTGTAASRTLGIESGALRYWVTAIRECFEECGVLLAYRDGSLFEPRDEAETARFDAYRNALIAGDENLPTLTRRENLVLATDRVLYFSHWITPASAPARFDTRFFVTAMPSGQRAAGHRRETVSGAWVTANQALAHFDAERWQMIHPTLTTLRTVARFATVDALLAAVAAGRHVDEIDDALHDQGQQRERGPQARTRERPRQAIENAMHAPSGRAARSPRPPRLR